MTLPGTRSRVVDVRSRAVLPGSVVDEAELDKMLGKGLRALTARPTTPEAWRQILGEARSIVLKFNSVGASVLGTSAPMARVLVQSLVEAGYDRRQLSLVEAPDHIYNELRMRPPVQSWGDTIPVGGRNEPLAAYVYEADAIINVPFFKTHHIAGMSGAMKNLSHALIRHPALYHGNGCSPFVAQVIGHKVVSVKVRLNIANALRVVIDGGPEASDGNVHDHGGLVLGYDPVAVDATGLGIITTYRAQRNLPQPLGVPYLASAAQMNVGRLEAHSLEQLVVDAAC